MKPNDFRSKKILDRRFNISYIEPPKFTSDFLPSKAMPEKSEITEKISDQFLNLSEEFKKQKNAHKLFRALLEKALDGYDLPIDKDIDAELHEAIKSLFPNEDPNIITFEMYRQAQEEIGTVISQYKKRFTLLKDFDPFETDLILSKKDLRPDYQNNSLNDLFSPKLDNQSLNPLKTLLGLKEKKEKEEKEVPIVGEDGKINLSNPRLLKLGTVVDGYKKAALYQVDSRAPLSLMHPMLLSSERRAESGEEAASQISINMGKQEDLLSGTIDPGKRDLSALQTIRQWMGECAPCTFRIWDFLEMASVDPALFGESIKASISKFLETLINEFVNEYLFIKATYDSIARAFDNRHKWFEGICEFREFLRFLCIPDLTRLISALTFALFNVLGSIWKIISGTISLFEIILQILMYVAKFLLDLLARFISMILEPLKCVEDLIETILSKVTNLAQSINPITDIANPVGQANRSFQQTLSDLQPYINSGSDWAEQKKQQFFEYKDISNTGNMIEFVSWGIKKAKALVKMLQDQIVTLMQTAKTTGGQRTYQCLLNLVSQQASLIEAINIVMSLYNTLKNSSNFEECPPAEDLFPASYPTGRFAWDPQSETFAFVPNVLTLEEAIGKLTQEPQVNKAITEEMLQDLLPPSIPLELIGGKKRTFDCLYNLKKDDSEKIKQWIKDIEEAYGG